MSDNSATVFSMLSERGFNLLVFEGFKFSKNRRTLCGQKWRCTYRKCSAHLFTDDNGDELFKAVGVHNHEPCPNLHRHCISNSVKRKATESLTEPPAKLIKKEIVSVPENISGKVTTHDMDRIRRNMNYAKRSKVPPLPRCVADVHDALDSIPIKTTQADELDMSISTYLDVERFIIAVQSRPELWDFTNDYYRDKTKKREAWKYICRSLFPDFYMKDLSEQERIERQMYEKWRTVRDGYVKSRKKEKTSLRVGVKRPVHRYIYSDQLTFLEKVLCLREAEPTSHDEPIIEYSYFESSGDADYGDDNVVQEPPAKRVASPPSVDPLSLLCESNLETKDDSDNQEDLAFFKSLLPMARQLDTAKRLQFRIQTMTLLQGLLQNSVPENSSSLPVSHTLNQPFTVTISPCLSSSTCERICCQSDARTCTNTLPQVHLNTASNSSKKYISSSIAKNETINIKEEPSELL